MFSRLQIADTLGLSFVLRNLGFLLSDMSSSIANNAPSPVELPETIKAQLQSASSVKSQIPLLTQLIEAGEPGYQVLMDLLLTEKQSASPSVIAGRSLQLLHQIEDPDVAQFLEMHVPSGVLTIPDGCSVDYAELQMALVQQDFEKADRLTLQNMCKLAGPTAEKRKWLYFSEVRDFPSVDLQTLDRLWLTYSLGKFGFSKQREIWLGVGKDWEQFWPKIAWKKNGVWTRYPGEFTWNIEAPIGHLPLTNQLRGVRVMDALMNHPAWSA